MIEHDANQPREEMASATEQRVSVVTGTRVCDSCGYDLTGQPVLREPHYDLLIVRCPECAAVACVQDYPLLGRWTGRLATIGAFSWLIIVLLLTAGLTGPIILATLGFSFQVTNRYESELRDMHQAWITASHPGEDTTRWWNFETFDEWWVLQDPGAVLAKAGGPVAQIDWRQAPLFFIPMLLALLLGGFLSIVLLHRRRRSLLVIALGAAALAGAIITYTYLYLLNLGEVGPGDVVLRQVGMVVLAAASGVVWLAWVAGLMLGRTAARLMVTALLPPRLRIPLATLWTSQGFPTPSLRSERRDA